MKPPTLQVSGLKIALPLRPAGDASPLYGARVRGFRLGLSAAAIQRLLGAQVQHVRLVPRGATLGVNVGGVRVDADLAGSVTAAGRLRLEATSLRVGRWLPVPPGVLALAHSLVEGKPGLRMIGSRTLELDLAALLEHLFRAWEWRVDARIRRLRIGDGFLEVECDSDANDGSGTA